MAKYSSEDYIRFKKTITNKLLIKRLKNISRKTGKSHQEICYQILEDGINADKRGDEIKF